METLVMKTKYRLRDGIVGGILAGIAMGIVVMVGAAIMGKGFVQPVVLIGHAFEPHSAEPFMSGGVFLKGLIIHMVMSMLIGAVFVFTTNNFLNGKYLWFWGMVFGGFVWLIDLFGGLQVLDPTMATHMNQVLFLIAHLLYGATLGVFVARQGTHQHVNL